ncbi:MAG: hypothetical protein KDD99_08865 [Bacteroidetes bacterium]|nr:hypothetical protein [Bacteroidota bacterium]
MPTPFSLSSTEQVLDLNERESLLNPSSNNIFKAFFHKNDFEELLNQDGITIVGVRFYPGNNQGNDSLIAVSVFIDSAGQRSDIESVYILSKGSELNDVGGNNLPIDDARINSILQQVNLTEDKDEDGNELPDAEKRTGFFSVFFSVEALDHLLNIPSCEGLYFYCRTLIKPGDPLLDTTVKPLTLVAVAVDDSGESLSSNEVSALESLAPCPPDCGDPDRYLNHYDIRLNNPIKLRP